MGGKKPVVGLTGGIASGKSAVSSVLRQLGVAVVDADDLAREVVAPGSDGLREIVATFGTDVIAEDGSLDRARMGALVFADADARKKLNGITHPRVARLSMERLSALEATETPYVVYEVPLLVESGLHRGMDATVVVAAAPDTQRARIMARDGLDGPGAQARMNAQLPLAEKVAVADCVIHNDGDLATLAAQTRAVHNKLLERFDLK